MAHYYDRPIGTEDLGPNEWDNLVTHTYTVKLINTFSGNTEILDTLLCLAAIERGKAKITATQAVNRALRNLRFFVKDAHSEWEVNRQLYGILHKLSKQYIVKTTFDRSRGSGNRYRKPHLPANPNSRIMGVNGIALTQREMRQLTHKGISNSAFLASYGVPPVVKCGRCGQPFGDDSPDLRQQQLLSILLGKQYLEATEVEQTAARNVWEALSKEQRDEIRKQSYGIKIDDIPTNDPTYIRCTPCRVAKIARLDQLKGS